MNLNNLKIGPRLAMGFASVLLLAAALTGLGLYEIKKLGSGLNEVARYNQSETRLVAQIERATLERAIAARNLMMLTDPAARKFEFDRITESKQQIDEGMQQLSALVTGNPNSNVSDQKHVDVMKEVEARYAVVASTVVRLSMEGRRDEAMSTMTRECIPLLGEVKARLAEFSKDNQTEIESSVNELLQAAAGGSAWLIGLGLASLALGAGLAWAIQRSVVGPLQHVGTSVRRVAEGDLTETIRPDGRDEVASIMGDVAQMQQHLREVVGSIRNGVDSVNTASNEIATGNHDLSQRTEQTASNLQQTASSMEQLTGTVRQSADSARQANQLAASAAEVAARGGSVVSEVVSTMDEINTASKKIADIIGVIDGIAFQTNILALNAAVEAARAGEQGRGFAVVASEVRNLASRSAEAAREIKALIGASVDKVESGSRLVANAGHTMTELVSSVQRVSDIIGEITAAAAEQSEGIGQVNGAVNQLDQMTQQNAALVEQSAAAAESLKEQSKRLSEVMSGFRLEAAR